MTGEQVYIALGSNLGDRMRHLQRALNAVEKSANIRVVRISSLYETAPIGPPQGAYLNAAAELVTLLAPENLLAVLRGIEDAGGRERTVRWGPRTIDLDILDFAGRVLETDSLRLPHPEMMQRRFVLVPLQEIAPGWVHPLDGRTVEASLQALGDAEDGCSTVEGPGWWRRESPRGNE